eukprot:COSAG01_NODE_3845_length_5645_cov_3.828705_7_plen_124_part_00
MICGWVAAACTHPTDYLWMSRPKRVNAGLPVLVAQELRQTAEATRLIARWLSGGTLSTDEWRAVKEQASDLAKSVPLLGLMAVPGGSVVILACVRIAGTVGINVLPSSFRTGSDETHENDHRK